MKAREVKRVALADKYFAKRAELKAIILRERNRRRSLECGSAADSAARFQPSSIRQRNVAVNRSSARFSPRKFGLSRIMSVVAMRGMKFRV